MTTPSMAALCEARGVAFTGSGASASRLAFDKAATKAVVAATGVTDGALLSGVRFNGDVIETETIVYRSLTGTVRRIAGEHRELAKFHLD